MKFTAQINVMPLKEILDPQGKAVSGSFKNMGLGEIQQVRIQQVRIGKHIELEIDAPSEAVAKDKVEEACKKLLANLIMESYEYTLKAV